MKNDRHIKVKGRVRGGTTVMFSRNEICYAIKQKEKFLLALVFVGGDRTEGPYYIRNILEKELGFGVTNETYDIAQLMTKAQKVEETL